MRFSFVSPALGSLLWGCSSFRVADSRVTAGGPFSYIGGWSHRAMK